MFKASRKADLLCPFASVTSYKERKQTGTSHIHKLTTFQLVHSYYHWTIIVKAGQRNRLSLSIKQGWKWKRVMHIFDYTKVKQQQCIFFFAEEHFLFFRSEKVTGRQIQGSSIHACMQFALRLYKKYNVKQRDEIVAHLPGYHVYSSWIVVLKDIFFLARDAFVFVKALARTNKFECQ